MLILIPKTTCIDGALERERERARERERESEREREIAGLGYPLDSKTGEEISCLALRSADVIRGKGGRYFRYLG